MIGMYNNVQPQIADASVFTPNIWPIVSPISQSKAWVCVCDMLAKGENEIKRVDPMFLSWNGPKLKFPLKSTFWQG